MQEQTFPFESWHPFGLSMGNDAPRRQVAEESAQSSPDESILNKIKIWLAQPSRQNRDISLNESVLRIIGANGKKRFDEFKMYPSGWAGGQGKRLSHGSVFALEKFLAEFPELSVAKPSLFLSYQGNLALGLEDKNGGTIEIEFLSNGAEYFLESLDEEDSVTLKQMESLMEKVKRLLN